MSDYDNTMDMIQSLQIEAKTYTKKQFMCDEAVKAGAKVCVSLRGVLDYYFDKKGDFLGTSTEARNSWRPKK